MIDTGDDELALAPEDDSPASTATRRPWKVLVVDDEEGIHEVTLAALNSVEVSHRPLQILHAYTGAEAKRLLAEHDDIAMCLLDVVMETDDAGLQVASYVRNELNNPFVRIVLRTGQPGQAPEREIIVKYDLNGYKEKADLTATRLFSEAYTMVSAYRDLRALETTRKALERIIRLTKTLSTRDSLSEFASAALEQLGAVLSLEDAICLLALGHDGNDLQVLAATDGFGYAVGQSARILPADVFASLQHLTGKASAGDTRLTLQAEVAQNNRVLLHLMTSEPLTASQRRLADLYCENISLAIENIELRAKITP